MGFSPARGTNFAKSETDNIIEVSKTPSKILEMVDLEEVVDDDVELLQRPKENRLVTTLTSSKATVGIELIKLILLFVICVVAGLLLVARSRNAPPAVPPVPADNGEAVPPVPSQPAGASP